MLGNLVAQVCLGRIGARDAITQGEREGEGTRPPCSSAPR